MPALQIDSPASPIWTPGIIACHVGARRDTQRNVPRHRGWQQLTFQFLSIAKFSVPARKQPRSVLLHIYQTITTLVLFLWPSDLLAPLRRRPLFASKVFFFLLQGEPLLVTARSIAKATTRRTILWSNRSTYPSLREEWRGFYKLNYPFHDGLRTGDSSHFLIVTDGDTAITIDSAQSRNRAKASGWKLARRRTLSLRTKRFRDQALHPRRCRRTSSNFPVLQPPSQRATRQQLSAMAQTRTHS